MTKSYDVHAIKSDYGGKGAVPMEDGEDTAKLPEVCIPIDKSWASDITAGKEVTLSLTGKVVSVQVVDPEKQWNRNEVRVEVSNVELDDSNEYEELAND